MCFKLNLGWIKGFFDKKKKHLVFLALLFWSDYKQVDDAFSVAILNDASTGVIIIIFLRRGDDMSSTS
jgi:hypothetical protein